MDEDLDRARERWRKKNLFRAERRPRRGARWWFSRLFLLLLVGALGVWLGARGVLHWPPW